MATLFSSRWDIFRIFEPTSGDINWYCGLMSSFALFLRANAGQLVRSRCRTNRLAIGSNGLRNDDWLVDIPVDECDQFQKGKLKCLKGFGSGLVGKCKSRILILFSVSDLKIFEQYLENYSDLFFRLVHNH